MVTTFRVCTSKRLVQDNCMTFPKRVANNYGFLPKGLNLNLVWNRVRRSVFLKRETKTLLKRNREQFSKFAEEVGFLEDQLYHVTEVPGLGNYASEFVKIADKNHSDGTIQTQGFGVSESSWGVGIKSKNCAEKGEISCEMVDVPKQSIGGAYNAINKEKICSSVLEKDKAVCLGRLVKNSQYRK